jgi:predicted nuclease with TOPRIM domain
MHFGADVDDARLVEVAQRFLADVRDVAGDVLRPELGVAGHDLELLDVDRGEDVVLRHDPLEIRIESSKL